MRMKVCCQRWVRRGVMSLLFTQLMLCGYLLGPFLYRQLDPPTAAAGNKNLPVAPNDHQVAAALRVQLQVHGAAEPEGFEQESKDAELVGPRSGQLLVRGTDVKSVHQTLEPRSIKVLHDQLAAAKDSVMVTARYLLVEWRLHLGFNNVRYQLEIGVVLASLLRRRLVLPPLLRMRKCLAQPLCEQSRCVRPEDDSFWCPIDMFLDPNALARSGSIVQDSSELNSFVLGPPKVVANAFERIYEPMALWLDKIPFQIQKVLGSSHVYSKLNPPVPLSYFTYGMGCELAYGAVQEFDWSKDERVQTLHGLIDTYQQETAPLLVLQGVPHRIGAPVMHFSSRQRLRHALRSIRQTIAYHPDVLSFGQLLAAYLLQMSPALLLANRSFVCVHLRRGDFVTAGWTDANSVEAAGKTVAHRLAHEGEPVYLATDEQDGDFLQAFKTGLTVVRFNEVSHHLVAHMPLARYLFAFEDYVGLVEQAACARARFFWGSHCSSFTGGIINMRRQMAGEAGLDAHAFLFANDSLSRQATPAT